MSFHVRGGYLFQQRVWNRALVDSCRFGNQLFRLLYLSSLQQPSGRLWNKPDRNDISGTFRSVQFKIENVVEERVNAHHI